jgi:hypothetical protein
MVGDPLGGLLIVQELVVGKGGTDLVQLEYF